MATRGGRVGFGVPDKSALKTAPPAALVELTSNW